MSPGEIRTLLHIYALPLKMENEGCCPSLEENGLIVSNNSDSGWMTTPKGDVMVKMLIETPFPELVYADPRTLKVIRP